MRRIILWAAAFAAGWLVVVSSYAGLPSFQHLHDSIYKRPAIKPRGHLTPIRDPFVPSPTIARARWPEDDIFGPVPTVEPWVWVKTISFPTVNRRIQYPEPYALPTRTP